METVKIRRMTAVFGRLKNDSLELAPGLNVICAPNESGKSTWCGFIRAMLYGIDTSDRDKAGYLAPKTRFRPWDGGAMSGRMELSRDGRDITLERAQQGAAPMKSFTAVYTGTSEPVPGLSGENAGEMLAGAAEHVFERTAFIRRPDLRISQTSELEKRISALVSAGDERASFTEADALLRKWQRKYRVNRATGSIPALEQEVQAAERRLAETDAAAGELASMRGEIARLTKQIAALEADTQAHKKLALRAQARRVAEARAKALSARERADELGAGLTVNGKRLTRGDVADIRANMASVQPLTAARGAAEKNLWRAEKEYSDVQAKKSASPFAGAKPEDAEAEAARARELAAKAAKAGSFRVPKTVPAVLTALGAVCALLFSGLLYGFTGIIRPLAPYGYLLERRPALLAVSLAVLAAGIILLFVKPKAGGKASAELGALLEKYGVTSAERLKELSDAYAQLLREEEMRRGARAAAKADYESARSESETAWTKFASDCASVLPGVRTNEEAEAALSVLDKKLDAFTRAEFDAVSSQNVYETLAGEFRAPEAPDEGEYIPLPLRSAEDTAAALERAGAQLQEVTRAYDTAAGGQRALGDPAVLEGQIASLRERIASETRSADALALADSVLSDANAELQTRFSPLISRRAGEIMSELTAGRYGRLAFDRDFNAAARTGDDPVSRPVLALSEGTADEVYFALRLAICELILSGDDPCPVILDDALSNFDDVRCAAALDVLQKLAQTRQVILFTCHGREGRMLAGSGANILAR